MCHMILGVIHLVLFTIYLIVYGCVTFKSKWALRLKPQVREQPDIELGDTGALLQELRQELRQELLEVRQLLGAREQGQVGGQEGRRRDFPGGAGRIRAGRGRGPGRGVGAGRAVRVA